jgi:GTP1/Obg family GTP-binding protein
VTLYNTRLIQKQARILSEQLKESKRRDRLHEITQLRGRREEIEDMYMSNVQAMLECQRLKIILKKIKIAKINSSTLFADGELA